jgi:hypothetical protein
MAALPLISLAVTAVSAVGSAINSSEAGAAQQNAANYNAQVAANNASIASQVGQANAQQAAIQGRIQAGKIAAAEGASGFDSNSGTPLMLLSNQAAQSSLNQQNALFQGQQQANSFANQSQLDTYQGQQAATAGNNQAVAGLLTGASNGVGNYYRMTGMNSTITNPFSMGG